VIVLGAGHNGLVAALMLARKKLNVVVVEEKEVVGGAARTERPFAKVPQLSTSTGAYLLGLMPPELMQKLGVAIPVLRRDPHYFLPTTGKRYLLFGSDQAAMKSQFESFFSAQDFAANQALQAEISALRDDVHRTWLAEPLSIEETASRFVRPALQQAFVALCRQPVGQYLDKFGFKSDLLKAMYAVTDGFSGLNGDWDTPGTGMNFLIHNMCRLPGADGTWMIVKGGMGTVTQLLAAAARAAGARIETGRPVQSIVSDGGVVRGVVLRDGSELRAKTVVVNADPFRMRALLGEEKLPKEYNARLDNYRRDGTTMKVNLALKDLPRFTCLPDNRGQFGSTMHLLPDEQEVMGAMREAFLDVKAGRLPRFPTIEWYVHTTVDPSMRDPQGHHNSALFVQWVPYELKGTTWAAEEARYVEHLLGICDRFAPGTSSLVADVFAGISITSIMHSGSATACRTRHPCKGCIRAVRAAIRPVP
jgi:phytoene dehydrogenase-like protein